jgi:hypothetical protein
MWQAIIEMHRLRHGEPQLHYQQREDVVLLRVHTRRVAAERLVGKFEHDHDGWVKGDADCSAATRTT